ncbi:MAG TPA: hypothetical protein VH637_01150 [Streptosporangiaceae bacterium]|jgi:hypothetical protein
MKQRGAGRGRAGPRSRLGGLRWVPIPLAIFAAVIGALVMGSFQGQVAAANATQTGYRAGGLAMSVDTTLWMMNMKQPNGYQMPQSEMPGMQSTGDDRLRVEVSLSNVTTSLQRYSTTDFSLASPGGKTWKVNGQGFSTLPASANLEPGFGTTIDLYFDVPAKNSKNLTLKWSRGGTTVSIPVNTGGMPRGMKM